MAESAVSFLLDQLSSWFHEESRLLGGLGREVECIRDEMEQMRAFLRVADANEDNNLDLKEWVRQVREISYDVEDILDKYMLQFRQPRGSNGIFTGYIRRVHASLKHLKAQRLIASQLQDVKCRLVNVSECHKRYRQVYQGQGSTSAIEMNVGRGEALFLEEDDVVGVEEPKGQLLKWIKSTYTGRDVIAVVGMGGLGKTTLAKKVYDDESVKRCFNHHVWVAASDYRDAQHLLENLIKKLVEETNESPPQELEQMSVDDMNLFVHEFLKEKKYITVVDDVRDVSRWEAIRYAFPKKVGHGCIIITTRFNMVADVACSETNHVYNMKPLSAEESKALFYRKAFPRKPCPLYLRKFAQNVLDRCEGLPLAIVVIGGVLATKNNRAEEWEKFDRSLIHELEGGCLQRLWKLLSLSYNDLPYYLKYCFLYLSIFPRGGLLYPEETVRLWIAEGFVQPKQGQTVEEVAEDYLNELFSRSLLQVAEQSIDGSVWAFRIHDLLREYITSKSREHNIVTIYNGGEMQWPNKIRRLAILKSINLSPETKEFEYLRSLLLLSDEDVVELSSIKEFSKRCRLLKVLDLGGAPLEIIPNEVFKLYHLKYLGLGGTMVKHIPKSIKYLDNLETLDLEQSDVTEVPDEILKLHKLRHLLVWKIQHAFDVAFDHTQSVKAPCSIGSCLPSLQSLCCIDADEVDGVKMVREVGKLTQLRRLSIGKLRSEDGKDLCSSIAKLANLGSLKIFSADEGEKMDLDYSLSSHGLPFLRKLDLSGCIEKLPQWIHSLNGLTSLNLVWSRLREDPLNCLQRLPNLAYLCMHDAYVEGLSFGGHGFEKLKVLSLAEFKCLKRVTVEEGAMPVLQEWAIWDCKLLADLPEGIQHLTNLQWMRLGNMPNEFVDRVVQEKIDGGDNWRLARVPNVRFGVVGDGFWTFKLML